MRLDICTYLSSEVPCIGSAESSQARNKWGAGADPTPWESLGCTPHSTMFIPYLSSSLSSKAGGFRFPVLQEVHKWNVWAWLNATTHSSSSLPLSGLEVATSGISSPESVLSRRRFFHRLDEPFPEVFLPVVAFHWMKPAACTWH